MKSHFYLRDPKADFPTPIHFFFNFGGKRLVYPIGYKVLPTKWDFDKERPLRGAEDYTHIQHEIERVKDYARELLRDLTGNNVKDRSKLKSISLQQFRTALRTKLEGKEPPTYNILSFIKEEIKKRQALPRYTDGTISAYENLRKQLEAFLKDKKVSPEFEDIGFAWMESFRDFLYRQNLSDGYIAKLFSVLKTFIRIAKKRKLHNNSEPLEVKITYELHIKPMQTKELALTLEQVKELIDLKTDLRSKRMVRDLIVASCLTGLRISDWGKLTTEFIQTVDGFDFVEVINQKTSTYCFIPLLSPVKRILSEYGGRLPVVSYPTFKKYAREIGKELGYTDTMKRSVRRGGKAEIDLMPEYETLAGHTGRRSWNSNCRDLEVPDNLIRLVTGHKEQSMTERYDHRETPRKAKRLIKYLVKMEQILSGNSAKEIAI